MSCHGRLLKQHERLRRASWTLGRHPSLGSRDCNRKLSEALGFGVRDPQHPGESHGWERSADGGYSELGRPAPPSSLAEGLQPEDCWLRCLFTQAFPHRIWISFHEEIQKPQALLQSGSEELPPPGIACPQRSPPTPGVHPVCK